MRPEDILFDGMTHIREDLIEQAQRYVFRRRIRWRRYAGLAAACLALALGLNLLFQNGGMGGSSSGADSGGPASGNAAPPGDGAAPWEENSFIASVVEVNSDGSLIVVPQPGSGIWSVADRVTVPLDGVREIPDVQPGDRILVVYTGRAEQDFVDGVTEIRILED